MGIRSVSSARHPDIQQLVSWRCGWMSMDDDCRASKNACPGWRMLLCNRRRVPVKLLSMNRQFDCFITGQEPRGLVRHHITTWQRGPRSVGLRHVAGGSEDAPATACSRLDHLRATTADTSTGSARYCSGNIRFNASTFGRSLNMMYGSFGFSVR